MYATSANMPHVTSPEFNSRVIYQRGQLQNSSVASVGNFHDSSMNYFNYPNMQSYPGEFQSNSVPLPVGVQRSNTMDDRSSSNYPNLPTSRNPFANSVSNSHEYYALENMDNRESLVCQQSISQGQSSGVRRINRSPFESSAGRKSRSWTDAVFASMDREAESILELVNEDAMELERIAATIKQVNFGNLLIYRGVHYTQPNVNRFGHVNYSHSHIFSTSFSKQTHFSSNASSILVLTFVERFLVCTFRFTYFSLHTFNGFSLILSLLLSFSFLSPILCHMKVPYLSMLVVF